MIWRIISPGPDWEDPGRRYWGCEGQGRRRQRHPLHGLRRRQVHRQPHQGHERSGGRRGVRLHPGDAILPIITKWQSNDENNGITIWHEWKQTCAAFFWDIIQFDFLPWFHLHQKFKYFYFSLMWLKPNISPPPWCWDPMESRRILVWEHSLPSNR